MYGLGFALQDPLPPCSSIVTPAGWVGPIECDPSDGGPVYTAAVDSVLPAAGESFTSWLNRNYVKVGLGALAGLLFLSLARGGRR
jgi:hypothetical protein